jgi:cell division protein FtsB
MKKGVMYTLGLILILLQYSLWCGEGSLLDVLRLSEAILREREGIEKLSHRNRELDKEVADLKLHPESLEERARSELGMIKQGETFFIVVEPAR